jgi:hypothetical protein
MALSKAETRSEILRLAKELDVEAPANLEQIDKLDLLLPILEGLQAKKADADEASGAGTGDGATGAGGAAAEVGGPPPPPTLPELPAAPKKLVATTYVVNEGKMVTTKRGPIGALEHVWPKDFAGGQRDLDHWVAHGFVTKTDHFEQ